MAKEDGTITLYTIHPDLRCLKCNNNGAVKCYGHYYPKGLGKVGSTDYGTEPVLTPALGFGGTIPYRCLNCGNVGLYEMDGLEGYRKTFEKIKIKEEENHEN